MTLEPSLRVADQLAGGSFAERIDDGAERNAEQRGGGRGRCQRDDACSNVVDGYYHDLALVDDTPFTVRREDVLSKCAWSPFEGTTFHSRIASTWVNGQLAWDGSKLVGEPVGSRLAFAR